MAWTSSASSNAELVANLQRAGIISSPAVIQSMLSTDRSRYVPSPPPTGKQRSSTYAYGPYADAPQSIGWKSTISAPHVHGLALESLSSHLLRPSSLALDVGSGSGIVLAYFSRIAPPGGRVFGIEIVAPLVEQSSASLRSDGVRLLQDGAVAADDDDDRDERVPVSVSAGDAYDDDDDGDGGGGAGTDLPAGAQFDAIHVGAAASKVPHSLLRRLAVGGRMVIPLGDREQQVLTAVDKISDEEVVMTPIIKSRYLPLQRVSKDQAVEHRKLKYDDETNEVAPSSVARADAAASASTPQSPAAPPDYDSRYRKGYAYGTSPSAFLASAVSSFLPSSSKPLSVLSIGEGQGRNVCHLASLGHSCLGVDTSSVGLSKALALASKLGVSSLVSTQLCDVSSTSFEPGLNSFDVVLDVFCPLPAASRSAVHEKCYAALRPGGVFIIQCFSPAQRQATASEGRPFAAGPSDATAYWSHDELRRDFERMSSGSATVLHAREVDGALDEGKFHRGRAITTEFVVKKAFEVATTNCFRTAVDDVYEEALSLAPSDDAESLASRTLAAFNKLDSPSDQFLFCAPVSLRISCEFASRHGVCRYCWLPLTNCLCKEFGHIFRSSMSPRSLPMDGRTHIRWIVFSHPNEFLRSTSTAKIAAQMLGEDCEFLVYGAARHHERLKDIVASCYPISILFPGDLEDSLTVEQAMLEGRTSNASDSATESSAGSTTTTPNGAVSPHFIIVPDGSWECAKALVNFLLKLLSTRSRACPPKPFVRLNDSAIADYTSPLIEALNAGSGLGRISTLEAMAFFLKEAKKDSVDSALNLSACVSALQPLVSYVQTLNCSSSVSSPRSPSVPALTRSLESAVARYVASSDTQLAPIGLRRCGVCGAVMSSHLRMRAHLSGKRHCEAVAHAILEGEGEGCLASIRLDDVEDELLRTFFNKYSTVALQSSASDPPDFAMAMFQIAKEREATIGGKGI